MSDRGTWRDLAPADLLDHGLVLGDGPGIQGTLRFERPAYPFGHRLKNCTLGAFTFFNAAGLTSAYRVHFGRYSQIGESSVLGPPEHPQAWFSNHPFAFTRPSHMPSIYRTPDFVRLGPEEQAGETFVDTAVNDTWIGHEAYVGVGSFVRRGVRIGDGAVVGARSVVTRDIPPYAVAVGSPAKVLKLRFDEKLVERYLKLQWWRYDLAPFKTQVDFSQVEATLDFFEQRVAEGQLQVLRPPTYTVRAQPGGGFAMVEQAQPLFFA